MNDGMLDDRIADWVNSFMLGMRETFGDRLLLVALVGSWARGEATADSDIDFNVILDTVGTGDLLAYRRILLGLGGPMVPCGFLLGRDELPMWPPFDWMSFHYGTIVLHGDPDGLVPRPTRESLRDYIAMTISQLSHGTRHRLIYSHDLQASAEKTKGYLRIAGFVLRTWLLLTTGTYHSRGDDLLAACANPLDRRILAMYRDWGADSGRRMADPVDTLAFFEEWSRNMLYRLGEEFCGEGPMIPGMAVMR